MTFYQKVVRINRYYRITKFYDFLKKTSIKGGVSILIFVAILAFLEYFFIDIEAILNSLVTNYSATSIFSVFLVSETFLGLIPPEIFIAWSSKTVSPWLFLTILASLSYLGGVISYYIGKQISKIPSVKDSIENKISNHIKNLRKWGGLFVVIGALLPLPHSIVSMACGLIKYSYKSYLMWALFRFLRFLLYGLVIFQVF